MKGNILKRLTSSAKLTNLVLLVALSSNCNISLVTVSFFELSLLDIYWPFHTNWGPKTVQFCSENFRWQWQCTMTRPNESIFNFQIRIRGNTPFLWAKMKLLHVNLDLAWWCGVIKLRLYLRLTFIWVWPRVSLVKSSLLGARQLPKNESPLKNGFYKMLIALFVLQIIWQFLSWLFGYVPSGLTKKLVLISELWRHWLGNK